MRGVRAWLFRVAHNLAVDKVRRAFPAFLSTQEDWKCYADPAPDAEQVMVDRELRRRVRLSLRRLSPQERHCLELRAEGLRYREIAEVLGIKISTVVTFLERAVEKIRQGMP